MKIRYIQMAIVLAASLTACNDKTEYIPAIPDAADCMGVYFDADNATDFVFVPGADCTVTLLMHRLNSTAAAEVPIVGACNVEGVDFPASAHFDAGSPDTEITIDFAGIPQKTVAKFAVSIPDEYINHYAATLFNYESTALVSQWIPANADGSPVKFIFTDAERVGYSESSVKQVVFEPVESEMEILPGANMLRISNFLNSGVDLTMRLDASTYPNYQGKYRLSPLDNYYTMKEAYESDEYGDPYFNAWYLIDDESGDYATANLTTLAGAASTLDYLTIYWYSGADAYEASYAELKPGKNTASMYFWAQTDGSVSLPTYAYIYFCWDQDM